jgi:hypothetical protein
MLTAKNDFTQRCLEIEEYLAYLKILEKQGDVSSSLLSTMKSSAILMIYNLVESTMSGAIQALFDDIETNNATFILLNTLMKEQVLKYVKNTAAKDIVEKIHRDSKDLAIASFPSKEKLFSGNIDSKKIEDTLQGYGIEFNLKSYKDEVKNIQGWKDDFKSIKDCRNELSHGEISFADKGKFFTVNDLLKKHEKIRNVLDKVLSAFENYIKKQHYLYNPISFA